MSNKTMYKIKWLRGYGQMNGKSQVHSLDFFNDSNGFDEDDIEQIADLEPGESHNIGGPTDSIIVTRTPIKESTGEHLMNINRTRELAGLPAKTVIINERYKDSSEFDTAMDKMSDALNKFDTELNDSNMKRHVKDTDKNFDTDTESFYDKMISQTKELQKTVDRFYKEMQKAI